MTHIDQLEYSNMFEYITQTLHVLFKCKSLPVCSLVNCESV